MREFFVGTSGYASPALRWSLPAPSAAALDLLGGYASRFAAVEMDSCFYRKPGTETVLGWRNATPEPFRVTVRVPRDITHIDRLSPEGLNRFVSSLEGLGERLGSLLFTMPAHFDCDVSRLLAVLRTIPEGLRTAWEFRDASWSCPEVMDVLAANGSAPVIVDSLEGMSGGELLPGGSIATRWEFPFCYVRFRKNRYRPGDLMAWGELLGEVLDEGRDVYAFFKQSEEATSYATALTELLTEATSEAFDPPTAPLAEAFSLGAD